MDILQIDEIFLMILKNLDIDDICSLLLINKFANNKISKFYENNDVIFNDMPLFRTCNNISIYLKHYKSFISGTNFPDEPLWLFNYKEDEQFVEIENKYIKSENNRFDRPKFFNYFTSYKYQKFEKAFNHWKRLNDKQKYIVWCAITNIHPEIKLDKSLASGDIAILLSEIYWHYPQSFIRYYLEIYCIDNCDLINAKCIAKNEIESELEYYRGTHFLRGYKDASDKKLYLDEYFDTSKYGKWSNYKHQLLDTISNGQLNNIMTFQNLMISSDILSKEIILLENIIEEIKEFTITKTNNLKTNNINYLDHMGINYPNDNTVNINYNLSKDINACIQQ